MGSAEFCATFIQSENVSCVYDEGMTLGIDSGDDWIIAGIVYEKPRDCNSCPVWFIDVCEYYEWVNNIISSTSMMQGIQCKEICYFYITVSNMLHICQGWRNKSGRPGNCRTKVKQKPAHNSKYFTVV